MKDQQIQAFKDLLEATGLTSREFAVKIRATYTCVCSWLEGTTPRGATIAKIHRFAAARNCTFNWPHAKKAHAFSGSDISRTELRAYCYFAICHWARVEGVGISREDAARIVIASVEQTCLCLDQELSKGLAIAG